MERIAVLDVDSIAYAIASPNKIPKGDDFERDEKGRFLYEDKTESEIEENAFNVLKTIFKNCQAENYVGFIKGKNTGKHRYAIKNDYKHNRSGEQPSWWEFTSKLLKENYNIYNVDNYEVDDIVNIYRLQTSGSFIVACDKDLLNLTGVHFNWRTNSWQANTYHEALYYFWRDMIAGQSGDGIKGLPRKGEVFAQKFLEKKDPDFYAEEVFSLYRNTLANGISEFSKNYECLKILDLNDPVEYDFSTITLASTKDFVYEK